MKRGTIDHPKTIRLIRILDCEPLLAVGILESLFQWTAKYAICGDIGKFPNQDIADGIKCRYNGDILINALVESKWVDAHPDPKVRLVVHDWHDHADQSVQKTVKNKGLTFFSTFPEKYGKKRKKLEVDGKGKPQPKPLAIANSQQPDVPLPAELDSEPCRKAVADWVEHRKEKKKPATRLSLSKLLNQWAKLGAPAFVEAIDHSIANGWTGVFPPNKNPPSRGPPPDDEARQSAKRSAMQANTAAARKMLEDAGKTQ